MRMRDECIFGILWDRARFFVEILLESRKSPDEDGETRSSGNWESVSERRRRRHGRGRKGRRSRKFHARGTKMRGSRRQPGPVKSGGLRLHYDWGTPSSSLSLHSIRFRWQIRCTVTGMYYSPANRLSSAKVAKKKKKERKKENKRIFLFDCRNLRPTRTSSADEEMGAEGMPQPHELKHRYISAPFS